MPNDSHTHPFYLGKAWKDCRKTYLSSVGNLCEICAEKGIITPAYIVHHKTHLTVENLNNPDIALNYDNLQAVCINCHNKIHFSSKANANRRYKVDEEGNVMLLPDR